MLNIQPQHIDQLPCSFSPDKQERFGCSLSHIWISIHISTLCMLIRNAFFWLLGWMERCWQARSFLVMWSVSLGRKKKLPTCDHWLAWMEFLVQVRTTLHSPKITSFFSVSGYIQFRSVQPQIPTSHTSLNWNKEWRYWTSRSPESAAWNSKAPFWKRCRLIKGFRELEFGKLAHRFTSLCLVLL